jgi:hypothetical protein
MSAKKIASPPQEQDDELPPNGQRRCLTIEVWEYEKKQEKEVEAVLSPEDFRVWMIQKYEHLSQMSFKAWGTPLPVELSLPRVQLPPELAHIGKEKIYMMTKKGQFLVLPSD